VYHTCTTQTGICICILVSWFTDGFVQTRKIAKKICCLMLQQSFVDVCCNNYSDILVRLNVSALRSRWRHLHAPFLINVFLKKITCSSIFDSVSVHILSLIIKDYYTLKVNHSFKVSPSARRVSTANAPCKDTDYLTKIIFRLRTFKTLLIIRLPVNFSLSILCRFHILHTFGLCSFVINVSS
jgi:hypothetical protein